MGLGIWAAAGSQGLWRGTPGGIWRQYEAPPQPMRLAQGGGRVVAACAGGEVFEVSSRLLLGQYPGVEAMALSSDGRYVYLLSGETDSLMCSRADTGEMLYLNRAGSYPRDVRLDSRGMSLAVAAGAAGETLVFSAPELRLLKRYAIPGVVWQALFIPGGLAVMTAVEEGQIFTLLGGVKESFRQWAKLPGLPGALCLCPDGTLAAATSECLMRCCPRPFRILWQIRREGLPNCLCAGSAGLLISDSLMGWASLVTESGREQTVFESNDIFAQWQV